VNYALKWTAGAITPRLYFGLIVADTAGAVGPPLPAADDHADWMAYRVTYWTSAALAVQTYDEWQIGSKRRMEEIGERAFLVAELVIGQAGDQVTISMDASTLLLMP
jgi:hypothetical protein